MRIFQYAILIVLLALAAGISCGQAGDMFGSREGIPYTGVGTWQKLDLDPVTELVQPYIIDGDAYHHLTEPCYLVLDGVHHLFYEVIIYEPAIGEDEIVASEIHLATSLNGIDWEIANGGEPVLEAGANWEGNHAGAPTILLRNDELWMYYAGGNGAGIGLAISQDGVCWQKYAGNPLLKPDQQWEGGPTGIVGAPSVVRDHDRLLMYYSGGVLSGPPEAQRGGYAIGMAQSEDGLTWHKRDTNGRTDEEDTPRVEPILTAEQTWEGLGSEIWSLGVVASPHVIIDHPVDRDIYRMYYSGNLVGDPLNTDVSVGYAGSFDGVHWETLNAEYNPVLQELFALAIPGITEYTLYGEFAPSVIHYKDGYRMIYGQTEPLDVRHGLGIAVSPPPD